MTELRLGRRSAGRLRLAFAVTDAVAPTRILEDAGARVLAPPTPTPWGSLNTRLVGPEGIDVTLFSPLDVHSSNRSRER